MEASQAVAQSMAKKIKLKVVIGTKRALAESFLKLLPPLRDADEDFDAPMLQASRKPFQTRATQRVGEVLSVWLSTMSCRMMSWCCKALNFVEMSTLGAGDCDRIGDRFLPDTKRCLHAWLRENLVEGLRSGIQTSFYTCDYTTKPALTCGPVLRHLTVGMQRLEERMQIEAETAETQRLLQTYPLPEQPGVQKSTPEQQEARKRLCRLWTAANHAVMHGHCLMAIHMLTGREVLRTHIFWRLMLKRVLWGVFEEMRRHSGSHDALEAEGQVALADIGLAAGSTEHCSVEAGVAETHFREVAMAPPNDGFELRTTSFYEDYLHRGDVEPLASMNFYVYGMHVSCVHVQQVGSRQANVAEFDFAPHYAKAKYYVQILHPAPRVPYLHGVTMPTKEKDPEMWAAVHIAVLRKHHCLDGKYCGQAQAVNHIRKIPLTRRRRILVAGGDIRQVADKTGVLSEWKATEAEMQTLADRADVTWQILHDMV